MNAIKILGRTIEHPIMNAAGTCKTVEDVSKIAKSASAAIMVGSVTTKPRTVNNIGNVFHSNPEYALNSLGMPNPGLEWYKSQLPSMATIATGAGKPLFVSVAGFSPAEYAQLGYEVLLAGAHGVELNLGCPNIWDSSQQKKIPSFDPCLLAEILETASGYISKFGIKLSPYSDPALLSEVASVIGSYIAVDYVATSNTFPNTLAFDKKGNHMVHAPFAGMSGPAMKPIALGQVRQFCDALPSTVEVVGVGGVANGADVLDYLRAGAATVQMATAYLKTTRTAVFSEILSEYIGIISQRPTVVSMGGQHSLTGQS